MSRELIHIILVWCALIVGGAYGIYVLSTTGGKYACECDREFKQSRKDIFSF
jgi:hypothetical protein